MRSELQQILNTISRNPAIDQGELESASELILQGITKGLAIDRASVWLLSDNNQQIHCNYLVDGDNSQPKPQLSLNRQDYPRYFAALDCERNIVADDAHHHPQTCEFSQPYLTPLGICAMLDTPIRHHGVMVGIICIEHRAAKHWHTDEIVFAGFLADIYGRALSASERQRYQLQLEQLNSSLEQVIEQRTHELSQSLTQLQHTQHRLIEMEKMASLGRLVAGIAHEINTPLGVAVTANSHAAATLLQLEQAFQHNQLTRQQFLQAGSTINSSIAMVNANLLRAVDLVNSFKQTATAGTEQQAELIELKQFLPRVISSVQSLLAEHQAHIHLAVPEHMKVQSFISPLSTIITKLIENACLHAFSGDSDRQITFTASEHSHYWQIEVADNGRGMTENELNRAFEPFFTSRRNLGSKGLGLTLVFNLVTHLLRGEISLHNQNTGCLVKIKLPLDPYATL
ncbi:GAF domain-containing sensor histidine kinase [Rheinheimera muenzenbergensis]|uniref:histidine kinase n=1 Tax=Rheinheimera muenzenbergensis TaxID=1193628 RepID=A0ABU8C9M6_9GAMM